MSGVRVRIWDLPTRIFHWALVAACATAFLTGDSDEWRHVHVFAGYIAAGLVVFRLAWGFIGTRNVLFRSFAATPRAAVNYLLALRNGSAPRLLTHNPAGAWAVFLLLGAVALLAATGLVALGGEEQQGPLAGILSRAAGSQVAELHGAIAWAGVLLVAAHVFGVIVESRVHRENLVRAMLDGNKPAAAGTPSVPARAAVALALLVVMAACGAWYFRGYAVATPDKPYLPYTSASLPTDARWQEECGSCHLAYHPSLLPARSWEALFARQADHFGDDLMLDADIVAALQAFARAHAAEQQESEAALKIARSVPPQQAPLRITETPYWRHKHAGIDAAAWKSARVHGKGDCAACHYDAEKATFEDAAMRVPR